MSRHAGRIASGSGKQRFWQGRRVAVAGLVLLGISGCGGGRGIAETGEPSPTEQWVQDACEDERFDFSSWPKFDRSGLRISVPEPHKETSEVPDFLYVRTQRGNLTISLNREARYAFDVINDRVRAGRKRCMMAYGDFAAEVVSWYEGGQFGTAVRIDPRMDGADSDKWVFAVVQARDLSEATLLRRILRTLRRSASGGPD